ncbi:MAG: hypothetical protein M1819_006964 [Sarea resinae]|nr:MAG: hypothetical protein M1819_006964 [Sarea resinae]
MTAPESDTTCIQEPKGDRGDKDDNSNDGNNDDENLATFSAVMASLRLDCLPTFALSIRARGPGSDFTSSDNQPMQCTVLERPLFGSYHIVYPLEFSDGVRWILKVPATGHRDRFDEMAARALTSEALTMRLLKRETTIPCPEVYLWDASLDNELHCPFILMDYVAGIPLYDCWFDRNIPRDLLESRRKQILRDLAKAMVQMNQFAFSKGGAPLFNEDGQLRSIGPMRNVDVNAMLVLTRDDDTADPDAVFCESGPFSDYKSFFLCMLDRRDAPPDEFSQGLYKLLRLFINWISESDPQDEHGFVLTHPDLDIQNVIVSEEGSIQGLIDWDGVSAVPRCIGNDRYPSWLTRDWDEVCYRYSAGPECNKATLLENSPEELEKYRALYARFIESSFNSTQCGGATTTTPIDEAGEANLATGSFQRPWTRGSLLLENLQIAADDPVCTHTIMVRLFEEIKRVLKGNEDGNQLRSDLSTSLTGGDREDKVVGDESDNSDEASEPFLYETVCDLVAGEADPFLLDRIKSAFLELFSK